MGLLNDVLIENRFTFVTQSITLSGSKASKKIYEDKFVSSYAATLTQKGKNFVEAWKSATHSLLDAL